MRVGGMGFLVLAAMLALPATACEQDVAPRLLFPMAVEFGRDVASWDWTEREQRQVRDICHFLNEHPDQQVRIAGYTGKARGHEYNMGLAQRFADVVKRKLVSAGCPAGQLNTVSYGEEKEPVVKSRLSPWRAELLLQGG